MTQGFGRWQSPLDAADVAVAGLRFGAVGGSETHVWWSEGRPAEGGRTALMRRRISHGRPLGMAEEMLPAPHGAGSRLHEYGGGELLVTDEAVFFIDAATDRPARLQDGRPLPLVPELPWRFADMALDAPRRRLIACAERMDGESEPQALLVAIDIDRPGMPRVLARGADFISSPRLSPDGTHLAWIEWDRPHMPWDEARLMLARLGRDGGLGDIRRLGARASTALQQPLWLPDGSLCVLDDSAGQWEPWRIDMSGSRQRLARLPGDAAGPPWTVGQRTVAAMPDGRLAMAVTRGAATGLLLLDRTGGAWTQLPVPLCEIDQIVPLGDSLAVRGAGPRLPGGIYLIDSRTGATQPLRAAEPPPALDISVATALEVPTAGGDTAQAWYFPPCNGAYALGVEPGQPAPPAILRAHGGPTAHASPAFNLRTQFWTSRGFAVVDVNYRGSSGFGRAYRHKLRGQWGVVDAEDMLATARLLVDKRLADPARLAATGGSAGGFTVLRALAEGRTFAAGSSWYGVTDLVSLAAATHKFESRYDDWLLGPPALLQHHRQSRSPVAQADRIATPLLLLQGLEDRVVPKEQAEAMAAALEARAVPVELIGFPGERHGFRRQDTLQRCFEAELAFFLRHLVL